MEPCSSSCASSSSEAESETETLQASSMDENMNANETANELNQIFYSSYYGFGINLSTSEELFVVNNESPESSIQEDEQLCCENGETEVGDNSCPSLSPSESDDGSDANIYNDPGCSNALHVSLNLNHPSVWGNTDHLVEFRYDIIDTSVLFRTDPHNPGCSSHSPAIFNPYDETVFTCVETVVHYYSQPVCFFINGQWLLARLPTPVAQHVCIALDDGVRRYEEIIRLDATKYVTSPDLQGQFGVFTTVQHRITRGNPTRRPQYRDMLKKSLQDMGGPYTAEPMEMVLSRATGRAVQMDTNIARFFVSAPEPFETFVQPIIQHVPQTITCQLAGTNYVISSQFFRPVLSHASIHISSGKTQLFETASINISYIEKRIFATAHDSALARVIRHKESRAPGLKVIDAISYTEFGPDYWGPQLLSQNSRLPSSCNPFKNLHMNPVFNRDFNAYTSPIFIPPANVTFQTNTPVLFPGLCCEDRSFPTIAPILPPPDAWCKEEVHDEQVVPVPDVDSTPSPTAKDDQSKPGLNALAPEFIPGRIMHDPGPVLAPSVPTGLVHNLKLETRWKGPKDILVSCLLTDTEELIDEDQTTLTDIKNAPDISFENESEQPLDLAIVTSLNSSEVEDDAAGEGATSQELELMTSWSEQVEVEHQGHDRHWTNFHYSKSNRYQYTTKRQLARHSQEAETESTTQWRPRRGFNRWENHRSHRNASDSRVNEVYESQEGETETTTHWRQKPKGGFNRWENHRNHRDAGDSRVNEVYESESHRFHQRRDSSYSTPSGSGGKYGRGRGRNFHGRNRHKNCTT